MSKQGEIPATYIPWNRGYWLQNPFSLHSKNYSASANLTTEITRNATEYLQPSADETLQCTALLKNNNIRQFDLISIPCDQKFRFVIRSFMSYSSQKPRSSIDTAHFNYFVQNNKIIISPQITCFEHWTYNNISRSCIKTYSIGREDQENPHDICKSKQAYLYFMKSHPSSIHQLSKYIIQWRTFQDILHYRILVNTSLYNVSMITDSRRLYPKMIVTFAKEANYILCERQPTKVKLECVSKTPGVFQCRNKMCIWEELVCDGKNDCEDSSDEADCEFLCKIDNHFPGVEYCRNQCLQPSCQCHTLLTQLNSGGCKNSLYENYLAENIDAYFSCQDGQRIDISLVNDFIPDCAHAEDENAMKISQLNGQNSNYCQNLGRFPCSSHGNVCFQNKDVCVYDTNNLGVLRPCRTGTHLAYCTDYLCIGRFKCFKSFCLPVHKVCNGVRDCPFGEDETNCSSSMLCPGLFRCQSGWCVHPNYICDGHVHCGIEADDEVLCTALACPDNCTCHSSSVMCENMYYNDVVIDISNQLHVIKLFYSGNRLHNYYS